jgi:NAD-dependent SIR2 family protein deacetylase
MKGRYCKNCKKSTNSNNNNESNENRYQLRDSIIHFGEKLRNGFPYNWEKALETIKQADLIICLGII